MSTTLDRQIEDTQHPAEQSGEVTYRKAIISDGPQICALINHYAEKKLMLPRSQLSIYENIRDFTVAVENGRVIGCSALHFLWNDLAEVRCLAVDEDYNGRGVGKKIVKLLIEEARQHCIPRIFALTYVPQFFEKLGFRVVPHETLPRKIYYECINCPNFNCCDEIAMIFDLD